MTAARHVVVHDLQELDVARLEFSEHERIFYDINTNLRSTEIKLREELREEVAWQRREAEAAAKESLSLHMLLKQDVSCYSMLIVRSRSVFAGRVVQ